MAIIVRLKLKHREHKISKKSRYRPRTGPKCCNANCGSTRKKRNKKVKRLVIGEKT